MPKKEKWEINFHPVSVKMSDGSVLTGMINIRNFPRLSDYLREGGDRFIVVVEDQADPPRVLIVNKAFVMWAVPNPAAGTCEGSRRPGPRGPRRRFPGCPGPSGGWDTGLPAWNHAAGHLKKCSHGGGEREEGAGFGGFLWWG